jgi:hypothetical protein
MDIRAAQPKLRPIIAAAALLGLALTFASWPAWETAARCATLAGRAAMDAAATRSLRTGRDAALPAVHLGHWSCQVVHVPLPSLP